MPRSRKTLASAAASTDGGAGNVMTASGGLTALTAAATAPVVSGSLTMTALSRCSGAASGTLAGCGRASAAVVVSTGAMSATLAVPSDIADVFEMWLNTV